MNRGCVFCANIRGCSFLQNKDGTFNRSYVLRPDAEAVCPNWAPVGPRQETVRARLYELTGDNSLQVLFMSADAISMDLKKVEEEEYAMMDPQILAALLSPGMPRPDREQQLRYQTDPATGEFLVDASNNLIPRPHFQVLAYATGEQFPIQMPVERRYDNTKQVVEFILTREAELGLITGGKATKKTKETEMPEVKRTLLRPKVMAPAAAAPAQPAAPAQAAPQEAPAQEAPAAPAPRRMMVPNKAMTGAPAAGPAKVATPTKKPAPAGLPPPVQTEAPAAPAIDLKVLADTVTKAVMAAIEPRIAALEAQVQAGNESLQATMLDTVTILHDVFVQSAVLPEGTPTLFDDPNKILAYTAQEGASGE